MPHPDLVGITAFTSQASRAYGVAAAFRGRGVMVVMGGIHATMCRQKAMRHVDAVVTGEAESVWATVLADARHGRLPQPGPASRDDVGWLRHASPFSGRCEHYCPRHRGRRPGGGGAASRASAQVEMIKGP